jgi:hypothetical protein
LRNASSAQPVAPMDLRKSKRLHAEQSHRDATGGDRARGRSGDEAMPTRSCRTECHRRVPKVKICFAIEPTMSKEISKQTLPVILSDRFIFYISPLCEVSNRLPEAYFLTRWSRKSYEMIKPTLQRVQQQECTKIGRGIGR